MKFVSALARAAVLQIIFVVIFSAIFALPLTSNVHAAQKSVDAQIVDEFNKTAIKNAEYDDKIFVWNTASGLICALESQLTGYCPLYSDEANGLTAKNSALTAASTAIASIYAAPPASGIQYFAHEIDKFNPVKSTYAAGPAGIGYDALSPVQAIWTVFRNISYVGFILVFIVIGFMIMFRAHISSQAVATVQDSIPRIVIALILVTFSYAIAGLMIDIMFLVINVAINMLGQATVGTKPIIDTTTAQKVIFSKSIFGVIVGSWGDIFGTVANSLHNIINNTINLGKVGDFLVSWSVGGIAGLIVGIGALFIMFRIFIMLLMAYVMIILLTLAAPFYFLIQALPGNNGAKEWFKQMGSNIAVFPIVSFMIILAGVIGGIGNLGGIEGAFTQQAEEQILHFPLLVGGLQLEDISRIIAIGILFLTPQAAELVRTAIGVKGGPNLGGAVMGGVMAGAAAGGQFGREVAPHVPFVGTGLDLMAARRNETKLRRQAIENERILGGEYAVHGNLFTRKGH